MGYRRDEVIGRPSTDFLTEESRCHALEISIPAFRESGVLPEVEYQVVKKNGKILDVLLSAVTQHDDEGKFASTMAVMTDVTERNRADATVRDKAIELAEANQRLSKSEQRFRSIFDRSTDAIFLVDIIGGKIVDVNKEACRMLGYQREELQSLSLEDVHPDKIEELRFFANEVLKYGRSRTTKLSCLARDGKRIPVELAASMIDIDNKPGQLVLARDITERLNTEQELRSAKQMAEAAITEKDKVLGQREAVLENIDYGIMLMDADLRGTFMNRAFREMWKVPPEIADAGASFTELLENMRDAGSNSVSEEQWADYVATRRREVVEADATSRESTRANGTTMLYKCIPLPDGGRMLTNFDITGRKKAEAAIARLALEDSLTDLPNRVQFQRDLNDAISLADRSGRLVGLMLLDLDNFKDVNDSLGHPAGDALLRQVAKRITSCLRQTDTVARLGGHEFAVIGTHAESVDGIIALARRIADEIARPFVLDEGEVHTGTSIGITIYPHDKGNTDQLLRNADLALYQAKAVGRGSWQLYDRQMHDDMQSRRQLETDLRRALAEEEFHLVYQPQIDARRGKIIGAEALLRWSHPTRGNVPPNEFIPIAEATRMIVPISNWVLETACRAARNWHETGLDEVSVAVNIPPLQFKQQNLVDQVRAVLEETEIRPELLELELTESVAMAAGDDAIHILKSLKKLGVKLAIDDFGTGYSSLNRLKQFPVDRLKIDQTFVRDIVEAWDDAAISAAVIRLGHVLNIKVIAEGVESPEQLKFLIAQGCDEMQGFLFSRPLPVDEFPSFAANYDPSLFIAFARNCGAARVNL
jgi:diguanylate cyclase (GGDEF)-like protein/PAS domain S-box-containing protein